MVVRDLLNNKDVTFPETVSTVVDTFVVLATAIRQWAIFADIVLHLVQDVDAFLGPVTVDCMSFRVVLERTVLGARAKQSLRMVFVPQPRTIRMGQRSVRFQKTIVLFVRYLPVQFRHFDALIVRHFVVARERLLRVLYQTPLKKKCVVS